MKYKATTSTPLGAEWPKAVYWSPGEIREVPGSAGVPPDWLEQADKPTPKKGKKEKPDDS